MLRKRASLRSRNLRSRQFSFGLRSICPVSARAEIEKTVKAAFADDRRIDFEKAGELIGGIELVGDGHKISWSIGDYLSSLQDNIHEVIDQKSAGNESSD